MKRFLALLRARPGLVLVHIAVIVVGDIFFISGLALAAQEVQAVVADRPVDWPAIIRAVGELLIPIALAFFGAVYQRVKGVEITKQYRDILEQAMQNGVALAAQRAAKTDEPIRLKEIVDYLKAHVPDAVAYLKANDAALVETVKARIARWGGYHATAASGGSEVLESATDEVLPRPAAKPPAPPASPPAKPDLSSLLKAVNAPRTAPPAPPAPAPGTEQLQATLDAVMQTLNAVRTHQTAAASAHHAPAQPAVPTAAAGRPSPVAPPPVMAPRRVTETGTETTGGGGGGGADDDVDPSAPGEDPVFRKVAQPFSAKARPVGWRKS